MLLNFPLPVYIVRAFYSKFEEGDYVILQTEFNRYVLDNPKLEGDYATRRLKMLSMDLPYKLYPLTKRISTLSQLANCKAKYFITEEGQLLEHKKTTFYRVVLKKVISSAQIFNGKYQCYVSGIHTPFVLREPAQYLSLILIGNSYYVFDTHQSKPDKVRQRVKI